MLIKNFAITLVLCSLFALPMANIASAEVNYCSGVEILSAGSSTSGGKMVLLKNNREDCGNWALDSALWFMLDDSTGQANSMLATALTALTNETALSINPMDTTDGGNYYNGSILIGIYAGQ